MSDEDIDLRAREDGLPPEIRMSGRQRELRDGLYGLMLLRNRKSTTRDLETMRQLSNKEAQLRGQVNELMRQMGESSIAKCREAAKTLYGLEMNRARRRGKK